MYVKKCDLPTARGYSVIFVHDQSSAERLTDKHVKLVSGVSDCEKLTSCLENE